MPLARPASPGLELNLARNAAGVSNWEDLSGPAQETPAEAPADAGGAPAVDLDVAGIRVSDARLSWRDASTDQNFELTDLNFDAAGLGANKSFPLSLSFKLAGDGLTTAVEADGKTRINLADNTYQLDDFEVVINGEGEAWPVGRGSGQAGFQTAVGGLECSDHEPGES